MRACGGGKGLEGVWERSRKGGREGGRNPPLTLGSDASSTAQGVNKANKLY